MAGFGRPLREWVYLPCSVDRAIRKGSADKSLVEFKLAKNTRLRDNLQKQTKIYEKASDARRSIKVILFFTVAERKRTEKILKELGLETDHSVVLIDARKDNKPSGSKA